MARRRRSRVVLVSIAVLVLVVGLGGAFAYWWWGPRAEQVARADAGRALASHERCLLGTIEAPDEAPRRLRRLALARALAGGESAWPASCDAHLEAMIATLEELDGERYAALIAAARDASGLDVDAILAATLDGPPYAAIEALLARGREAELPAPERAVLDAVAPPPALPPVASPRSFGAGDRLFLESSGAPSFLVHAEGEAPVTACAVDDEIECHEGATVLAGQSFAPLPRVDGAPVVLADVLARADEPAGLVSATGEARGSVLRHGVVLRDGSIAAVQLLEQGAPVARLRPREGSDRARPLAPPSPVLTPVDAIVRPGVAAMRWTAPDKIPLVVVHSIDDDGAFADAVTIEADGQLRAACRLGATRAVVWAPVEGVVPIDFVITAADSRRHLAPVGAGRLLVRCLPDAVSLLTVREAGASVHVGVHRCTRAGCDGASGAFARRGLTEGAAATALDLGEDVLVVLASPEGPIVSLRAAPNALADATPIAVLDVPALGGVAAREHLLLPHRDGALLLLRDESSVQGVLLDPTGAPRAD